jgi:citrate synthase
VSRGLYPNVDFYSGIVFRAIGIPESMFTVMFAMGRSIGWVANWLEMTADPLGTRIARPRQLYMGAAERDYVPITDRDVPDNTTGAAALERKLSVI